MVVTDAVGLNHCAFGNFPVIEPVPHPAQEIAEQRAPMKHIARPLEVAVGKAFKESFQISHRRIWATCPRRTERAILSKS